MDDPSCIVKKQKIIIYIIRVKFRGIIIYILIIM